MQVNKTHSDRLEQLENLIGFRLKTDIKNKNGIVLLAKNTILLDSHIEKLKKHRIALSENQVTKKTNDYYSGSTPERIIYEATHQMKEIYERTRMTKKIQLDEIRGSILPAIQEISKRPNVITLLCKLQSLDHYTYQHTVGVGSLACMIGRWLKLSEHDLHMLTMGGVLHDIGKMKVPLEILNKPGKLTEEEFKIVKEHTIYGYKMIKETVGASERFALIALQHHEREDGKGYPYGIKGDQIDLYSKIVAVADVFHAMLSKRTYHDASPFFKVISQMQHDVFGKLDPKIVMTFVKKIMESLINEEVQLTNGSSGRIIMINPFDPVKPTILVDQEAVDLSKEPDVYIEKLI